MACLRRMTATVVAALCLPSAALAADDGVSVDPNSPSGKEYALPIDRARDRAAAGTDVQPSAARPAGHVPLFGVGVTARKPKRSRGDDAKAGSSRKPSASRTSNGSEPAEPAADAPAPARSAPAAASESSSMVGVIVLAAALMLGGGAIGTALRRR
jgi:hypothetical protein